MGPLIEEPSGVELSAIDLAVDEKSAIDLADVEASAVEPSKSKRRWLRRAGRVKVYVVKVTIK